MSDIGETFQSVAGQPHLDRRETSHVLRVNGCESKDRSATDVLPRKMNRADVEVSDELMEVVRRRGATIVALCVPRVAETSQVDREDTMVRGEERHELVKSPPGLRESVNQQDRGSRRTCGHVVELGTVDRSGVVRDPLDGGTRLRGSHPFSFLPIDN